MQTRCLASVHGIHSMIKVGRRHAFATMSLPLPLPLASSIVNMRESGIREVMRISAEMDRLNPESPVIHLEVGQPNFKTPKHIVEATAKSLFHGNTTYIASTGILSLREAIANRYSTAKHAVPTSTDQIIVTTGAMAAMFSLFTSILNPGDECLLPMPGFPNYQQTVSSVGAKSVPYVCTPERGYLPTIYELEALITPRTKCIVICNPGNPTGACFDRQLVQDVVRFAKRHKIFMISDEIYGGITFGDVEHTCAAEFDDHLNPELSSLIVVSGVSKEFAMTGFRVGWARAAPYIIAQLTKLQEPLVSCGVPFCHSGALEALTNPLSKNCVKDMVQAYKQRRDAALSILKTRGRPSHYIPGGAFYIPVDISQSGLRSREFALQLLASKRCAVAPGIAFNTSDKSAYLVEDINSPVAQCDRFIRVSLANSIENVSKGMHLICDFLDERKE